MSDPIVFIAGPMTGYPDYNRPAFFRAERELRMSRFTVINPAWLPDGLGDSDDYLKITLPMVDRADFVFALSGWRGSKGAEREVQRAREQGKIIVEQDIEGDSGKEVAEGENAEGGGAPGAVLQDGKAADSVLPVKGVVSDWFRCYVEEVPLEGE